MTNFPSSTPPERSQFVPAALFEAMSEVANINHYIATHDELTGRPNRLWLTGRLTDLVQEQPGNFAVLFVDLDGLKGINDTQGHAAGNQLIINAAEVLQQSIRTTESRPENERDELGRAAVRLAGDEFVSVLPGIQEPQQLQIVTDRMRINLENEGIQASIGGRVHQQGESSDALLASADQLMFDQKRERRQRKREEKLQALGEPALTAISDVQRHVEELSATANMPAIEIYRLIAEDDRL